MTRKIVEIDTSANGELLYTIITDDVNDKEWEVVYKLHEDMTLSIIKKERVEVEVDPWLGINAREEKKHVRMLRPTNEEV
jgi:hypothetical protein